MDFEHICLSALRQLTDAIYKSISLFRVVMYPWQEKRTFPTYLTQKRGHTGEKGALKQKIYIHSIIKLNLLIYILTYLLTYLLTYILTHSLTPSMVQSPSWEANWFAASQEIPRISRNPKVHYRTHKLPPPVSILDQPNPVHIPTSHLLEIRPNIIHPSTPRSPQWSSSLRFPQQDPKHPLSSPIRATCPAHLILLDSVICYILNYAEGKSFRTMLVVTTFATLNLHAVAQLVEALRYKPEGRGFDSRWCHWNFSLAQSFRPYYGPGDHSASNRSEYQNISWG